MHAQQVMYEREISGYQEICMKVRMDVKMGG